MGRTLIVTAPRSVQMCPYGHLFLDAVGLVPGLGEAADAINSIWYSLEGDTTNAALSLAAVVPFAGWAATGGKVMSKIPLPSFAEASGKILNKVDDALESAKRIELPVIQEWCFAPDTLVETPSGKRRIDEIREGESVFAFDFASGQWVARQVQACHHSRYLGAVIEITTEHGSVEATAYHPFWVLDGHDLENRPRPRELGVNEDEGLSVRGRWVNSHDLFAGDLLLTQAGRQLRVLSIRQRYEESFEVCNLTIDTNHSFAVGNDGLLVHNTGGCGKWGINAPRGIVSGHNPPISSRQKLHVDGTPGKSQFNPGVDVEGVVRTAWEGGTPVFDKNGKFLGKRFTFDTPIGTSPSGHPQNSIFVHWSPNHGIHGVPTTVGTTP